MLEQLVFALVAVALAAPFLVPVLASSDNPAKTRQRAHKTSGRSA